MQIAPDTIAAKAASAAQWGGAGGLVGGGMAVRVFGLTVDQWTVLGIVVGMALGVIGYATNVYFKRQHLRLAEKNGKPDTDE